MCSLRQWPMLLILGLSSLVSFLPARAQDAPEPPPLKYTASWFGNDFGDGKKWVQMTADAMFVAPDGTCVLNTFWDEGGREVGLYKDGDVIGSAGHTHGWGYDGAYAVTMNGKYLFIAQVVDNEGGGLVGADTWPVKGKLWFGVSRRTVARDLDFLRDEERAPLAYDDARHGFRLTDESYTLPPVTITRREAFSFGLARKLLAHYEGTPLHLDMRSVLDKIADETVAIDPRQIRAYMEKVGHPALTMPDMP